MYQQIKTKTKEEIQKEEIKLTQRLSELKRNGVVKTYLSYLDLPLSERDRIKGEWDKYFNDVRNTVAFKRYGEQSKALRAGDLRTVRDLAMEARIDLHYGKWELNQPPGYDPVWMANCDRVREYYVIRGRLDSITGKDQAESIDALV